MMSSSQKLTFFSSRDAMSFSNGLASTDVVNRTERKWISSSLPYIRLQNISTLATHEEMIRHRLVVGVRDAQLAVKLLLDPNLLPLSLQRAEQDKRTG